MRLYEKAKQYRTIFYEALPKAMQRLRHDSSLADQVEASVTYNMVVEGMLAETGYHAYFTALQENDLLPGQRQGIALLKQDESRHIAYGVFLLSRLMAEEPALWDVIEETMNKLFLPALGVINDAFEEYEVVPFGLSEDDFIDYATNQFQKRIERVERARGMALEEVYQTLRVSPDSRE